MPRAIGLMSGTSLDGVDAAWLDTDGESVAALGPSLTIPYDAALRRDLRALLDRAPTLDPADPALASAVARLTDCHIQAVKALERPADLIGFHGQTILHRPALPHPHPSPHPHTHRGRTWQVGDAARLARETGIPVAYDFRSADVAAGGEGAPLAPVYHAALARDLPRPLAVLNIGGVANVTWLGAEGTLLAFDTGPGNGPLDDWTLRHTGQPFDRDGALARAGTVEATVLARLMAHPYFARPAPKSLDRLDFSRALAASGLDALVAADGAATLVAFTAASIAAAAFPAPPRRWLVCGGGRRNPAILAALRTAVGAPVEAVETVGWDGDALEAQCFGFLAARVARGLPLSFPGTTDVPNPMPGGRIETGPPLMAPEGTILLINPNTSARSLALMLSVAAPHLPAGVALRGVAAATGAPMIVAAAELRAAAAEVLRLGLAESAGVAAIVVAAFGDPGVADLRRAVGVPVMGIGEASIREAAADGRRFGIATTTPGLVAAIEAMVGTLGLSAGFTGVRLAAGDPLALAGRPEAQEEALREAARMCLDTDGAEAVVIGGGPLSGAARALRARFAAAAIVEPVPAAIRRIVAGL